MVKTLRSVLMFNGNFLHHGSGHVCTQSNNKCQVKARYGSGHAHQGHWRRQATRKAMRALLYYAGTPYDEPIELDVDCERSSG